MYIFAVMVTVRTICDEVGRIPLAQSLNVSKSAITNAIAAGKFSPRWYRVVSKICADKGLDCPDDLFDFIEPDARNAEPAE